MFFPLARPSKVPGNSCGGVTCATGRARSTTHADAFYVWTRTHYERISHEEIRAAVYKFLHGAYRRTKNDEVVPFDPTRREVANVMEALAAETQLPGAISAPVWLDAKPRPMASELIVCTNGLLHLPTRQVLPHTPALFTLNAIDYAYDPDAAAPKEWLRFLQTVWREDSEAVNTLQEMFGLLLTGDTRHQKAFLIVGPKRSGKGTIARVLTAILGPPNVTGPTLSGLAQNFGLAPPDR